MLMVDDSYIKELYGESGRLDPNRLRDSWLNEHIDIKEYLENRYSDSLSYKETIYRIRLGIEIRPVCPVCGKPVMFETYGMNSIKRKGNPFLTYCSNKCVGKSKTVSETRKNSCIEKYGCSCSLQNDTVKEKSVKTLIEKYGVDNPLKSSIIKQKIVDTNISRYGVSNVMQSEEIRSKQQQSVFNHYGVVSPAKSDEIKKKIAETNIEKYGTVAPANSDECKLKSIQTSLDNYGTEHPQSSPIVKNKVITTNLQKYGVDNCMKLRSFVDKSYNSRKINGTYSSSAPEDFLYELLNESYVCYRQYISDAYPHECDFYIPELELYIEYNGTWTHGEHPYDEDIDNFIDEWKEKAKMSDYYKSAINTYTVKDPEKIHDAIINGLNYLCIYRNVDIDEIPVLIENEFTEGTKNKQLIIGTK